MQTQKKQQNDWKKLNNLRSLRMTVNLINYCNSQSKPYYKNNLIQFPIVHNDEQIILFNKKIGQQTAKTSNFRVFKAFSKLQQDQRKKNDLFCMNLLGLDIKQATRHQLIDSNKISRNKYKRQRKSMDGDHQKFKIFSKTYVLRNNTQQQKDNKQLVQDNNTQFEGCQSVAIYSSPDTNSISRGRKNKYLYQRMICKNLTKKQQQLNYVYQRRIESYTQLLWKVAFSHNIYLNFDFGNQILKRKKYKAYVGGGNNCQMIKGLIKRRFWWSLTEQKNINEINFIWTQIKVNEIFQKQQKTTGFKPIYLQPTEQEQNQKNPKFRFSKEKRLFKKEKKINWQQFNHKIMHVSDIQVYKKYTKKYIDKYKPYSFRRQKVYKLLKDRDQIDGTVHNHLENNFYLGNKKALFYNLKQYYQLIGQNAYDYIPLTFHIKKGFKDIQYKRFISFYQKRKIQIAKQQKQEEDEEEYRIKRQTRNIWIVKPGQNSNRGRGITVIDQIYELNHIIKQTETGPQKTYIVQLYIDRPFLYCNRKFDIRHYLLITNLYGVMRAYWYHEGYIRTSSYQFRINDFQPQIHLTNDAIQKQYPQYGRYQPANKLSYSQFQRYLDANYKQKKYNFYKSIVGRMKKMATDAAKSVFTKISPKNQKHNFEILGLDFMIDRNFRPWLIQINTNPCLQVNCSLLDRIIPYMVEQSLKLTLDVIYPPPSHYPNTCKHLAPLVQLDKFKYQLIFDSQVDGDVLNNLYKKVKGNLIEEIGQISEDQQFKDNGKQIKLDEFS